MLPTALKQKSREIKGNVRPQTYTFWIFWPSSSLVSYPYRIDLSKNPGDEYLMLCAPLSLQIQALNTKIFCQTI
jgi:hypothetical protein